MKISLINPAGLFQNEDELLALPAGNVLFREGDVGAHMYVLKSGCADIVQGGRVIEKAQVGSILGEMALLDDVRRNVTVIAVTDCRLVAINRQRLESLIAQTPGFLRYLKKVVAGRMPEHAGAWSI